MSSSSAVSRFTLSPSFVSNYIDRLPNELKLEIADQMSTLPDFRAYRKAYLTSAGLDRVPTSIQKKFAPIRIKPELLKDLVHHYEMNPYLGRLFDLLLVNHPVLDKTDDSGFFSGLSMLDSLEDAAFAVCPEFRHYNSCFDLWHTFDKPDEKSGLKYMYTTCNNEGTLDRCWLIGKFLFGDVEHPAISNITFKFLLLKTGDPRSDAIEATMLKASHLLKGLAVGLADVAGVSESGYSYSHRITPLVDVAVSSMAYELVSRVMSVDDEEKLMMFLDGFEEWKENTELFVEFLGFLKRISEEFLDWPTLECHWCCREEEEQSMAYMNVDDGKRALFFDLVFVRC